MVRIVVSLRFEKSIKRIDKTLKERLEQSIRKILLNPDIGKPLMYLRNERSLRIKPFRIIYSYDNNSKILYLLKFEHRRSVYKK